ncbi:MAG: hypothetical protein KDJ44_13285 [Rhodoblastus sp.]|nr:hypothetical protein [Rhodoblastus sp.]
MAIIFSLAAPVLALAAGSAIDYTRLVNSRSTLQSIVDGAALAGAQALRLANATSGTVDQAVASYVASHGGATDSSLTVTSSLTANNTVVTVQGSRLAPSVVNRYVGLINMRVDARAQARAVGNTQPICVIGLDPSQSKTLEVDVARVQATGCQVVADSIAADGVSITNGAQMQSGRLCASGGAKADSSSSYAPTPQTDCPAIADPLAGLPAPAVGACTFTNYKVTSGSQSLTPGVYCGGIEVGSSAAVNLLPGTYVLKDGGLTVKSNGSLSGNDVTLYFSGSGSTIDVKADSTISLTAPSTGTYAGILMFEDRNAPLHQTHRFESRNAPNLLGTIYLSRGDLQVGVKGAGGSGGVAVGATSAWTIVVARTLSVTDNQTLQLNTNYGATTVPPPDGVGPHVANAQLVQ